jgi:hypothetical protein
MALALALFGCGGHSRSNGPGGAPDATDTTDTTEPDVVEPQGARLLEVSVTESSACTLDSDGGVACFGLDQGFESAQAPVAGKFRDLAGDASANSGTGAALRDDGSVATWGAPVPRFPDVRFEQIAFDHARACGIRASDHSIVCGTTATQGDELVPGEYQQLLVAGSGGVCGLTTTGRLRCDNTATWAVVPPLNNLPPLREVAVDPTGSMGGCGIALDGALQCWGYYCPIPGTFSHVSLSYFDACALTTEGQIKCWNYRLALGDCSSEPSAVKLSEPPSGQFSQLASALTKKCAIEADGKNVRCWGL